MSQDSWVQLADELERLKVTQRLEAQWYAYVGSENYGIWILRPEGQRSEQARATFSLIAARAIEKLGIPPVPVPKPLQHCPHWTESCRAEKEFARQAGKIRGLSGAVPYGLDRVDWDAVDPCTRAWLELLRVESHAFRVYAHGTEVNRGQEFQTVGGTLDDLCGASTVYCKRCARDEIGARVSKNRGEGERTAQQDSAGPDSDLSASSKQTASALNESGSTGLGAGWDGVDAGGEKPPLLNVSLIEAWMEHEAWINKTLAQKLHISERAVSSIRNNGNYHGAESSSGLVSASKTIWPGASNTRVSTISQSVGVTTFNVPVFVIGVPPF